MPAKTVGRLRSAARWGSPPEARVQALLNAGCEVICIDTSMDTPRACWMRPGPKKNFPACEVIAGNVATSRGRGPHQGRC